MTSVSQCAARYVRLHAIQTTHTAPSAHHSQCRNSSASTVDQGGGERDMP